jgi:hypothetical protein
MVLAVTLSLRQPNRYPLRVQGWQVLNTFDSQFVTLNSAAVSAVTDQSPVGNVMQAASTAQPQYNANDANFDNVPSVTYQTTIKHLAAPTAAPWQFLNDGTGCTLWFVMRTPTSGTGTVGVLDTTSNSATAVGTTMKWDGANQRLIFLVNNSGTNILNCTGSNTSAPQTSNLVVVITCINSGGTNCVMRVNRTQVATANFTGTPAATAPSIRLVIGNLGFAGTASFRGTMAAYGLANRVFSTGEISYIENYAKYLNT